MGTFEKKELYSQIIEKWGIRAQFWMVVEECSELLNAIAKYKRGREVQSAILEELADVSIMIEQIACYFGEAEFISIKEAKLQRLLKRVQGFSSEF